MDPADRRSSLAARNLRLYPALMTVVFTPFMLPVIVLFWQDNGLDLYQVFLLQAIFAVAVVALEVPTGMVADVIGKRTSLVVAMATTSLGMMVYALGHSFRGFLVAELLLALGSSLYSGAGSALLYDSLAALGRAAEFQMREGRARALQLVSFALCSLLGGWVGSHSYRATVWMTAVGPVAALAMALAMTEAVGARPGLAAGLATYRTLIRDSLRFVVRHRLVRWQILFLATLTGSATWTLWLYQPYMQLTGLPVWAFGIAFTTFNLFAAWTSHVAHRVDRRCGRIGTVGLLAALQVLPLLLMAVVLTPLSFLFILGLQAVRGMALPIFSDRILRYTYADKRATVLSIGAMAGRLFFAATGPFLGRLANRASLPANLVVQAALLVVVLGTLLVAYLRIPAKYFVVKPAVEARAGTE